MAKLTKISTLEHQAVCEHLVVCKRIAEEALETARRSVAIVSDNRTNANLKYWESVVTAINWVFSQADNRLVRKSHDTSTCV